MISLFLVDEQFSLSCIPLIQKTKGEIVVIAIDFWAAANLHKAGISCKRPKEYANINTSIEIDDMAVSLARTWYKPISSQLTYKGINLGQMAEYDFTYVFVDALLSIQIVDSIFRKHKPDIVFLPPVRPAASPLGILWYETLPEALRYFAQKNKVTVRRERQWHWPARPHPIGWARHIMETEIERDPINSVYCLCSPSINKKLISESNGQFNIASPIVPNQVETNDTESLSKYLHNFHFASDIQYLGIPILPLIKKQLDSFYNKHAIRIAQSIEWANKIIDQNKPAMLVSIEDTTPLYRAVASMFVQRGLPVLILQHAAMLGEYMRGLAVMPLEGQMQAVWGEYCRQWHLERGKSPESQIVTGSPYLDSLMGYQKQEVHNKYHLDPNKKIITFTTEWNSCCSSSYTSETEEDTIKETLKAIKSFPEYQVVVKLHPGYQQKYERLVSAIAQQENAQITIAKDNLWDLLSVSDLAIVGESTVGLEAMILGKPVVVVNLRGIPEDLVYVTKGAALAAHTPKEIAPVIHEALHNNETKARLSQAAQKLIQEHCYTQDGQASKRVVDLIVDMINANH